jgi:hypothetical protein
MREIYEIINDEKNVEILAKEIIDTFVKRGSNENIDYTFDLEAGSIASQKQNTFFSFDTEGDTLVARFRDAQFAKDLDDLTDKEEKQLQQDLIIFIKKVCYTMTQNHIKEIRDKIRSIVLPGSNTFSIPLRNIEIKGLDIIDYSSVPEPAKYLLKIGKNSDISLDTSAITVFVHETQEKTGQTVEEVFEQEKNTNPLFQNVETLITGSKYLFDVTVAFFVDYGLNPDIAPT